MTSYKVHWQLLLCSTKIMLIVSTGFSSIIDTARIVDLYGGEPDMILRPSVCLSHHATAAPTCGGFAAERRAYIASSAGAQATAQHSAANDSSVTFTADIGS